MLLRPFILRRIILNFPVWFGNVYSDAKNTKDRDLPEAMYFGLYNALEDVLAGKKTNNLIILIGDAGDHQRLTTAYDPMKMNGLMWMRKK